MLAKTKTILSVFSQNRFPEFFKVFKVWMYVNMLMWGMVNNSEIPCLFLAFIEYFHFSLRGFCRTHSFWKESMSLSWFLEPMWNSQIWDWPAQVILCALYSTLFDELIELVESYGKKSLAALVKKILKLFLKKYFLKKNIFIFTAWSKVFSIDFHLTKIPCVRWLRIRNTRFFISSAFLDLGSNVA